MLYLIRALTLVFDGVLLQFLRGVGLVGLVVAMLAGAMRAPSWVAPVLAIILSLVSVYFPNLELWWLAKASSSSERFGFVLLVYFVISVAGYAIGRIARYGWRRRRAGRSRA